jgi:tRNA(Ile)-lysidine synthase
MEPHLDASNEDVTFFRNRLRHRLIPELIQYNPRFKQALVHSALVLQGDHSLLEAEVDRAWQAVLRSSGNGWVEFDRAALTACPEALRRLLFRRAGEQLRPASRDFGFNALDRLARFAAEPHGKQVDFINGMALHARGDSLILAAYEADLPGGDFPAVEEDSPLNPGQTLSLGGGWVFTCHPAAADTSLWSGNPDPWHAWLDADQVGDGLLVRPSRPGDVFQPLGMSGQRVKVRDFFINNKVPRLARTRWPLVVAGASIAWIPGLRMGYPCRVTGKTHRTLELSLAKKKAE